MEAGFNGKDNAEGNCLPLVFYFHKCVLLLNCLFLEKIKCSLNSYFIHSLLFAESMRKAWSENLFTRLPLRHCQLKKRVLSFSSSHSVVIIRKNSATTKINKGHKGWMSIMHRSRGMIGLRIKKNNRASIESLFLHQSNNE